MAKRKKKVQYTDNKGRTIVEYPDGSTEMYIGGKGNHKNWLDVSDDADKSVKRKRFLPDYSQPSSGGVATREQTPGIDLEKEH